MTNRILLLLIVSEVITSCNVSPEPINYGSDACHYCSMTIVDKQHAAEYVTDKGKAFKFDSIECMLNAVKEVDNTEIALYLVNSFNTPALLIDGTQATYLISESIPSPMGESLSAFEDKNTAEVVQSEQKGELLTWPDLKKRFKTP